MPLAIGIALSLVTGLYMLTNIAYLAVLSPHEMIAAASGSSAVAVVSGFVHFVLYMKQIRAK